jgi:CheY-like chemotaxis protein
MTAMTHGPWDVLVIDDEPVVRDGVRLVLGAIGARVAEAPDAASALRHPALADCKLVLCDLMLPDRDGIELVRAIRTLRPRVPLVVITGYATTIKSAEALAAGASGFLAKPFDDEELLAASRAALAGVPLAATGAQEDRS